MTTSPKRACFSPKKPIIKELLPYLKKGVIHHLTGGMEDVECIAQPCRALLERLYRLSG
ncbi:MAG: hypothetical protein QG599_1956 [Pseudomonadota bacterium]|nr:hypothetical protein [Pseudomonadota bacterium]